MLFSTAQIPPARKKDAVEAKNPLELLWEEKGWKVLTKICPMLQRKENFRNCYEMIPKAFQSREREKCHLNEQSWIEAEVPLL
ncbi:hypothetical protein AV530_015682 [Patagioenas fasciata monilis]|uniref:Uncharacterized protein n=1 Tax=Patagioenas fasciata monilis TaxID=372326 RepID=A0A1V4KIB4_PATFA|nr:hypothetical protein AV530_015682 [Patagioenas fasciata monilis]